MKRFMLIPALALALAVPSSAQVFTQPSVTAVSEYVVKPGDNLWRLAELRLNNPEEWRWILDQNPFLKQAGRQFTKNDGTFVVVIKSGETLKGLREVGVMPSIANSITVPPSNTVASVVEKTFQEKVSDFISDWWWLLLLLAGAGFIIWLLTQLGRDPVRSGPPQVTGGVSDDTVREQLARRGNQRNFTLIAGTITRGRGYGRMMVSYHGGTELPRNLTGETVYRARARYHDGREEDVYMLQGCGNDVTYGGALYRLLNNFRFEPEVEGLGEPAAPAPEPEVAAPLAPILEPAPDEPSSDEAELKIELKPAETPDGTALVRVSGASTKDMVLTVNKNIVTLRFHPKGD